MTIDTLKYVKKLEAAGVNRKLAEEHANAARDLLTRRIDTAGYMERLMAAGVDPAVAKIHARAYALIIGKVTR